MASACIVCSSQQCWRVDSASGGVTSDEKPWPRAGVFLICQTCGHVQKQQDEDWQADADAIYRNYDIYHISDGAEKTTFTGATPTSRSLSLLERLREEVPLREAGTLLDIGTGKGAWLAAFAQTYRGWTLAASDLDGRFAEAIRAIPGVRQFHPGPFQELPGTFDAVTLIHVLEHIRRPVDFLRDVRGKLTRDGVALIQVPYLLDNPFDLLVRDHCSHFTRHSLAQAAEHAGLSAVNVTSAWLSKEASLVARRAGPARHESALLTPLETREWVASALRWLADVRLHARSLAQARRLAVLGTSLAGTWLGAALGDRLAFFVDEDCQRVGKCHLNRGIVHPSDLEADTDVYMAFPRDLAERMHMRLLKKYPEVNWVLPLPPWPAASLAAA